MFVQETISVCIVLTVIGFSTAVYSYQSSPTSPCSLRIPSLLLQSGINSSDTVRCGNLLPSVNQYVPFSSKCQPMSGNVMYCTSPIVIYRNSSKLLPDPLSAEEPSNISDSNYSVQSKESFIECIVLKKGTCMKMFHHVLGEVIEEIPKRLDSGYASPTGTDILSISQAHCNSFYIENIFCIWPNETLIVQPINTLMDLLQKYILYDGDKIITALIIFNNSCKFEYRIDLLESPITNHLTFRSSLENLVSYNMFSNIPQLEDVRIGNLTLPSLPADIFLENTKLKRSVITHIMLEYVRPELFKSAVELTRVDFSNNRLQTLPEGLFRNNIHLRNLILTRNRIQFLPATLLLQTNNLTTLDISHNRLQDLQLVLFKNPSETTYANFISARPVPKTFAKRYKLWLSGETKGLQISNITIKTNTLAKIDISYNRLRRIPEEIFDGSIILTIFRAHHNAEIINLTGSHLFYSLQEFSMSDSNINNIDEDFFAKSIENNPLYVKKIDLSRNRLDILHPRTFWNCQELEILLLGENRLSKLEDGLFKDLISLRTLDVSGNMLSVFQPEAFNLRNILYLDFSRNRIHRFHPGQMISLFESGTNFAKRIDLSLNCLTTKTIRLPSVNISRKLVLKYISLQYTPLETNNTAWTQNNRLLIDSGGIRQTSPKELNYRNVQESRGRPLILEMTIGPMEDGKLLCPNPLKQFCRHFSSSCHGVTNATWNATEERFSDLGLSQCTEWVAEYNSMEDAMECPFTATCPENHYKSILSSAAGYYDKDVSFTCPVTISCPPSCRCYKRAIETEIVVNCNNKDLSELPVHLPPNTNVLYFNHNKLQNLHDLNYPIWSNLTELYVENNIIASIDKIVFPSKLKLVSLKSNKLESINKDSLYVLGDVKFFLSGNPWLCDCNVVFLKAKLNAVNKVGDAKSMFCASSNTSILNSPNDVLCPTKLRVYLNISLALSLGIVLPLFVGILFLLYYRNKELVKVYLFTNFPVIFKFLHSSRDLNADKRFDAFVSYSSSDRDIVLQMIEELENKEPHFKLCIHERNWLPGDPITSNIAKSVCCSRKSIIILSTDFIQSIWFPVELHTVYRQMLQEKINCSIIVIKGKIPSVSELDDCLQVLLKTKTYLMWGERWFWKKLRYALIQKNYKEDWLKVKGPSSDFIEKIEADIANAETFLSNNECRV